MLKLKTKYFTKLWGFHTPIIHFQYAIKYGLTYRYGFCLYLLSLKCFHNTNRIQNVRKNSRPFVVYAKILKVLNFTFYSDYYQTHELITLGEN